MNDIIGQIVPADLYHLNHLIGNLFTGTDRISDSDDFDLLGYRPIKERSQAETDENGEQDTEHTYHGAGFSESSYGA